MSETGEIGGRVRLLMLIAGPVLAASLVLFADLSPGQPQITQTAAVALWMALWWLTGAVPLAATALLPVVLFPAFGIMSAKVTAAYFVNDIIFLFLGGFMVALSMERWNLHRRIALRLLLLFGGHPDRVLLGFMVPTFFLSMWISNTATTMMMTPIALSLILRMEENNDKVPMKRFTTGLLLGIAYSASVGGTATLIGTPPNLSMTVITANMFPDAPAFTFASWFVFAFPLALALLFMLWAVLRWQYARGSEAVRVDIGIIRTQYHAMGRVSFEQAVVFIVFSLMALLWLTREGIQAGPVNLPGWSRLFPEPGYVQDGTVGIAVALILFMTPSLSEPGKRILDWQTARALPWDIVLLFGGGFALAGGFAQSGLAAWAGTQMTGLSAYSPWVLVLGICLAVSFLTELTSNAATTEMILPIVAALAVAVGIHPLLLIIPVTLSCSYAFMLPVATPPNALIFGTNRIKISDMARTGFAFNLVAVSVLVAFVFIVGPRVFGFDLSTMPDWAHLTPTP